MNNDLLDRHDRMQRLNRSLTGIIRPQPKDYFLPIATLATGIAFGMTLIVAIKSCDVVSIPTPAEAIVSDCRVCHYVTRHAKMSAYFRKAGSKTPEAMATAVLMTKSPRLLAAITVKGEKLTPPTARKTGYKGRYSGAWQTEAHWGKVTSNITDQALIAEFALDTHVKDEKGIIRGLNAYGGQKDKAKGKYAYEVLAELQRVP